ncbi:MAG: L,D-transpeptidase family protein [Oscillatoriales cyanobacterium SM2_1_8]|nr:L,D-transpeptidase family protein [Oscillatoriales cyanobacterium SM2_1_8]
MGDRRPDPSPNFGALSRAPVPPVPPTGHRRGSPGHPATGPGVFAIAAPKSPPPYVPVAHRPRITRLRVSLSQRRVEAFQGDRLLKSYPVAVGKSGWETPTGTFTVRQQFRDPDWQNPFTGEVIAAGDPDNPLGDRWIGFWTDGKNWSGFHGTPNRRSVGMAASHGCLRMFNEDIRELFDGVSPATVVEVRR